MTSKLHTSQRQSDDQIIKVIINHSGRLVQCNPAAAIEKLGDDINLIR